MLVCRHWRELICGTPLFWREIDISQPERSFQLCLARAGELPLYVLRSTQGWCGTEVDNLRTLAPYATRVQGVDFPDEDAELVTEDIAPFVLESDLSSLEVLILHMWDVALSVDQRRFPRLRSLSVAHARGLSGLESHTRLRTLFLSSCKCELSMKALVRVVQQNPELESLSLGALRLRDLPEPSPVTTQDSLPAPQCPLPHLKHLQLHAEPVDIISHFISFFLLPSKATVWLSASPGINLRAFPRPPSPFVLPSMLPPSVPTTIPSIALSTHVSLKVTDSIIPPSEYYLQNYTAPAIPISEGAKAIPSAAGDLKIEFPFRFPRTGDVMNPIVHGLGDLIKIFGPWSGGAAAPIRCLDVHGEGSDANARAWEFVFLAFLELEELAVRGSVGTTRGLWTALRSVGVVTPAGETRCAREGRRAKASSRLRVVGIYVKLEGGDIAAFFGEMLACLRNRAARGLRLEKLVFGEGVPRLAVPERAVLELSELIADGGGTVEWE